MRSATKPAVNLSACCTLGLLTLSQAAWAEPDAATSERVIHRLDRLNVVGSAVRAEEASGSAHYLSKEDLDKFDYRDIQRVLRQVPGVYLVDEEGFGLRPNIGIRGSGTDRSARVTLMEDGVLIAPAPYAAPAAYYFPTASRMQAIEVRKGSAAVKSGPRTTGGAVNLISTSIPQQTSGRLKASIGEDSTLLTHATYGGSGEHVGGLIEVVRQKTGGFKQLDTGDNTGYELDDYRAKLRFNSDANARYYQELEFKIGRTEQDSDETYLGLTDADFARTPNRRYAASTLDNLTTEHDQYEVRHRIEFSDAIDLTTVAYRNEFSRSWYKLNDVRNSANTGWLSLSNVLANPDQNATQIRWFTGANSLPGALRIRDNNRSYYAEGIQSVLGWTLEGAAAHDIELSVRWHRDEEDRFQHDDRFTMVNGNLALFSAGAPGSQDNRIGKAKAVSAYLQDEIRFGRWIVTPGLRYEQVDLRQVRFATTPGSQRADGPISDTRSDVNVLIPGLGATYLVNDDLTVFASAHRGYNPPSPGSPAKAEKSVNGEVGLRYGTGALTAELVGFLNDYNNLVGTCTESSGGDCTIGDQFDGGEARVQGIEATLGYTFGSDSLSVPVSLAYTFTDAEFRNSFSSSFEEWGDVTRGDELPYLPEHQINGRIGLVHANWTLDLGVNYLDAMRIVADQGRAATGERTEDAWVFDLSGSYPLSKQVTLTARVENLFDNSYIVARRPAGARPGLPRTAFVGVEVDF